MWYISNGVCVLVFGVCVGIEYCGYGKGVGSGSVCWPWGMLVLKAHVGIGVLLVLGGVGIKVCVEIENVCTQC